MEFNTSNGPVFTEQQTIQPYTNELRQLNLKEANSFANCIGGGCSLSTKASDAYVKDTETRISKFMKSLNEAYTQKEPSGIIMVEQFGNVESSGEDSTVGAFLTNESSPFIANDDRYIDPSNADVVHNETIKDYQYNSYADNRAPTFNQWTGIYNDNCNEQNRLKIAGKPMKYFVNQFNSPQMDPFMQFSIIGNQKQYNVRNEFERAVPTRLNDLLPVSVEPYPTTPFLGQNYPDRTYADTDDSLRWSRDMAVRNKKSSNDISSINYDRWDYVSAKTVQNAGQFGSKLQSNDRFDLDPEGYYKYNGENHVIMGNSAVPYFGVSSRDLLHNISQLSCGT